MRGPVDPRPAVIATRLDRVGRIVAVTGGKGGIGKSFVASTLALGLAAGGRTVGLLDLDFTGPCDHIFLGIRRSFPEERFGVIPPEDHGIRFMSIAWFSGDRAVPMRGGDLSDAIVELLAITQWGELDTLVIDMPPGIGDALLDVVRLVRRGEYLAVATRSRVVVETVRRTLHLLTAVDAAVLGVVENMRRDGDAAVEEMAGEFGVPFLGTVPFDDAVDDAVGDAGRLASTSAARAVRDLAARL